MVSEKRRNPRIKVRVPAELVVEGTEVPIRGVTSDLSLSGCYIETFFPFPVGKNLEIKLQVKSTLLILAVVATSDPQVGNGICFTRMLPEDIEELRAFIDEEMQGRAELGSRATRE